MAGAGDQAVSVAHLDHHGAKVGGIVHLLHGLGQRDALLLAQLGEGGSVLVVLLGGARIDYGNAGDVDLGGVAKDDKVGNPLVNNLARRRNGARILALGKDDLLPVGLGGGLHTVKKLTHRCCSLLSCGVPLTPLVRSVRGYWPVDCETVPGRPQGSLPIIGASVRINSQIEMRCALRTLSILFGRASRFEVSGPHGALGKDFHGNR